MTNPHRLMTLDGFILTYNAQEDAYQDGEITFDLDHERHLFAIDQNTQKWTCTACGEEHTMPTAETPELTPSDLI